jgi:predicted nucleic acid-binding protein
VILYLDTSALVKLYVEEEYSSVVEQAVSDARIVATHLIAYVEVHSAFARLVREGVISEEVRENILKSFRKDWPYYMKIGINQSLLERASEFVKVFDLKAYDSVHLAAADLLLKTTREDIIFGCFDKKLNKAAKIIGFKLLS